MKALIAFCITVISFNSLQAQILDNTNPRLLFNDHAEALTCVNYNNLSSPYAGYWTFTGGTQNTCAQDPRVSVTLSSKYKLSGSYSYFIKVGYKENDNNNQWGRAEWGILNPASQKIENQWRWTSVSILIDPNHAFESRRYQIAFDHKEVPDNLETPFWLGIEGNQYVIYGRYVDDPKVFLGTVETGVWVTWTLERNFTTSSDGYMRFYKNGVKVWERNGPNTVSGVSPIVRLQHGFYKWAWYDGNPEGPGTGNTTGDLLMYMDEIKVGGLNATLQDMLPGGVPPQPVPNNPPTCYAGNDIVTTTLPYQLQGTASDPDGDALTYKWTVARGTATFDNPNILKPNVTAAGPNDGLRLTVTDSKGASFSDTVNFKYNPVTPPANKPPVVNAGSAQTVTVNSAQLNGTASDPDGDALTYKWEVLSGTGTLSSTAILKPTVSNLSAGANTFRLTASDKTLSSASTTTITFTPPAPSTRYILKVTHDQVVIDNILRPRVTILYSDNKTEIYQ